MQQEGVGDARQPRERLFVARHERLAAGIGARHHQRQLVVGVEPRGAGRSARRLVEEQVVQRRIRQHDTEPCESRRDAGERGIRIRGLAQQHDRALGGLEQRALRRTHPREAGDEPPAQASITANGFSSRALRIAQPRDRAGIARVAGEVKAAQPLDRDDFAAANARDRGCDRIDVALGGAACGMQREPRPAGWARVRFGVKATVGG